MKPPSPEELASSAAGIPSKYLDTYTRIADKLGSAEIATKMTAWITHNTYLNGKLYSFKDHEFQLDIANDSTPDGVVKKCSQVGLTELSVRIALGMIAVSNGMHLIYVLPSATFGAEFAKARIDPIIESSPRLREATTVASNSSKMKRFGNSILYIAGAASQKQAISRPAEALFIDEFDFCDMKVLTSYASRLRHVKPPRKALERKFSTPTVSGYGISKEYNGSSMKRYLCKCSRCGEWQAPDFRTSVVIPGWDGGDFYAFNREDLDEPRYKIDEAYIACKVCGASLDDDLADPSRREWVAQYPENPKAGWDVKPFDLIAYNPTSLVIRQLGKYEALSDYWNFVHGETFDSETNQILPQAVMSATTLQFQQHASGGCYMGVDVGKVCNVVVLKPCDGKRHVIAIYRLSYRDGLMAEQILGLMKRYSVIRTVIDAMPDFSLGQELISARGSQVYQCYYEKGSSRNHNVATIDSESCQVTVARTKAFDGLAADINAGKYLFPVCDEMDRVALPQLSGMKRIEKPDDLNDRVGVWEKVGPDHYLHALMYANIACNMDEDSYGMSRVVAGPSNITGVAIGASSLRQREAGNGSIRNVISLFGVR